jgi:hypothetical protein
VTFRNGAAIHVSRLQGWIINPSYEEFSATLELTATLEVARDEHLCFSNVRVDFDFDLKGTFS